MKYFIVGLHSSGKREVGNFLRKHDVSVGRLFTNLEEEKVNVPIYNMKEYELFDVGLINEMFENRSYMFIKSLETEDGFINYKTYEGLSKWEYDVNQVHIFSPDQLLAIPNINLAADDICYVWLDNTRDFRMNYYINNKSKYSFGFRENVESIDMDAFVKKIYTNPKDESAESKVLYFTNETPERVATIVYSCIIHPDLLNIYCENFG